MDTSLLLLVPCNIPNAQNEAKLSLIRNGYMRFPSKSRHFLSFIFFNTLTFISSSTDVYRLNACEPLTWPVNAEVILSEPVSLKTLAMNVLRAKCELATSHSLLGTADSVFGSWTITMRSIPASRQKACISLL